MGTMASEITSLTTVHSTVYSGADQRKHQCLYVGNSEMTGEFPTQRTSNAENVSIWWRHHEIGYWPSFLGGKKCCQKYAVNSGLNQLIDDVFKWFFLNDSLCILILIQIPLNVVPMGLVDHKSTLFQVMNRGQAIAWTIVDQVPRRLVASLSLDVLYLYVPCYEHNLNKKRNFIGGLCDFLLVFSEYRSAIYWLTLTDPGEGDRGAGWGSEFVPLKKREVGSFILLHKISGTACCSEYAHF